MEPCLQTPPPLSTPKETRRCRLISTSITLARSQRFALLRRSMVAGKQEREHFLRPFPTMSSTRPPLDAFSPNTHLVAPTTAPASPSTLVVPLSRKRHTPIPPIPPIPTPITTGPSRQFWMLCAHYLRQRRIYHPLLNIPNTPASVTTFLPPTLRQRRNLTSLLQRRIYHPLLNILNKPASEITTLRKRRIYHLHIHSGPARKCSLVWMTIPTFP